MANAVLSWYWRRTLRMRFMVWWLPLFLVAFSVDTFRWRLPFAGWEYANVVPFTVWMGVWAWIDHQHAKQPRPDYDPAISPPV